MDYYRLMFKRFLTLWVVGVVLAGCGSSGGTALTNYGLVPETDFQLFGRAVLERSAAGATVELTDLSGNSLGYPQVEVDNTGNFRIPVSLDGLPQEFTVRVNLRSDSAWNFPVLANISDYGPGTRVYPNLLTTAAAIYRERNGGTQEQAESWVRSKFQIPEGVHLGWGVDESTRSYFRHAVFLARAGGDPAAFLDSLLAERAVLGQFTSNAEEGGLTWKKFWTDTGTSIIANIGADAISSLFQLAVGDIAQAIGLNIGDPATPESVATQLNEIQESLDELNEQLNAAFAQIAELSEVSTLFNTYLTLTNSLQPLQTDVKVQTQDLSIAAGNATITNMPFVPDQGLQNLLSGISGFDGQTALNQMDAVLLGNNESASLLRTILQLVSYQAGVPPQDPADPNAPAWGDSPFLSNTRTVDPYIPFVQFYAQQQLLALNLLVENANLSLNPSTVEDARRTAAATQASILEQSQYLRFPQASDFVFSYPKAAFTDRKKSPQPATPSGTLFYSVVQGSTTAYADVKTAEETEDRGFSQTIYYVVSTDGAEGFADSISFAAPGYPNGWRLPSLDEMQQLRELGLAADPNDVANGLAKLGFTNTDDIASSQYRVWYLDTDDTLVDGDALEDPSDTRYEINENDKIKAIDLQTGTTYGYDPQTAYDDLYYDSYPYIMVNYQSFDSTLSYEQIVAAGFQPTSGLSIALSEDGSQVTATLNGEDVTEYCALKSSNPNQLEVRSFGDDLGKLFWHPGNGTLTSQTITATLRGMDESTGQRKTLESSVSVPVPQPAPTRTLVGILLTPSNSVLINSGNNTIFNAVGFYDDQTLQDLTAQVAWSLELPDGSPYPAGKATINGSIPGILIFTGPILGDSTVVIKATLGSVTGMTQLEVATPF